MSQSIIAYKKAGTAFPDAFLDKVAVGLTCLGLTAKAKDEPYESGYQTEGYDPQDLKDLFRSFVDAELIVYLGYQAAPVDREDVQPYSVVINGDNPEVSAFLIGNVKQHFSDDPDSPKSHAFHTVYAYLAPKLQKIRSKEKDLTGFFGEIEDKLTRTELIDGCFDKDGKGMIALSSAEGHVCVIEDNIGLREYDWGWTTDALGFDVVEKPVTAPPAEPVRKLPGKLVSNRVPSIETPPAATEQKSPDKPAASTAEKPASTPGETLAENRAAALGTAPTEIAKIYVKCPPNISKNKEIRDYYEKHAGYVPAKYRDRPTVEKKAPIASTDPVKPAVIVKSLQDLSKTSVPNVPAAAIPGTGEQPNIEPPFDNSKIKPVTPEAKPAAKAADVSSTQIDPKDVDTFKEYFLAGIDHNSRKIGDPATFQNEEKREPSFLEKIGYPDKTIDFSLVWTRSEYADVCESWPKLGAKLLQEFRDEILRQRGEIAKLTEAKKPAASTIEKPAIILPTKPDFTQGAPEELKKKFMLRRA